MKMGCGQLGIEVERGAEFVRRKRPLLLLGIERAQRVVGARHLPE